MPDEYKLYGYELVRKEVKRSGNSGQIYLPQQWIGETVAVVRLDHLAGREQSSKYEIWTVDPWVKICDCLDEYDALSRLDLLQQLEPEKDFTLQEYSIQVDVHETTKEKR